jgi:hypothetical protein
MFLNLYYLDDPDFQNHNFSDFNNEGGGGPILRESARAIQRYISESYKPDPRRPGRLEGFPPDFDYIFPMTLSDGCCASFIRTHPELPITARDYFLSKAFQFLHVMIAIRYWQDDPELPNLWEWPQEFEVRRALQDSLDQISVDQLPTLCGDDLRWWWDTYADTLRHDLESALRRLGARSRRIFVPQLSARRKLNQEQSLANKAASLVKNQVNVNFETAACYLNCSSRHIRRLAKYGKLDALGGGQNRKITTDSLRRYKPSDNPE